MEAVREKRLRLAALVGVALIGVILILVIRFGGGGEGRVVFFMGEYRATYAGNCTAVLTLTREGAAEYRDSCGGPLELRGYGTWTIRGDAILFTWEEEPEEWTRQKRNARIVSAKWPQILRLDFLTFEKLPAGRAG